MENNKSNKTPQQGGTLSPSRASASSAISRYKGKSSTLAMILSKSGRGKTHSVGFLPPAHTHIITTTNKEFSFMHAPLYIEGENLTTTTDSSAICRAMKAASLNPEVHYLVIEDAQYVMATEFMDKANTKGFEKWNIMARHFFDILILCTKLRPGLKVFLLSHEEDDGNYRRIKTLGKLLEDKITPEGLSTIVLFAEVLSKSTNTYYFATQTDGNTTAKSPFGMFPSKIPNDLFKVANRIDEYYAQIPLKKSKINFDI